MIFHGYSFWLQEGLKGTALVMDFAQTFSDHAYCISSERNSTPVPTMDVTVTTGASEAQTDDTDTGGDQAETGTGTEGEEDSESQPGSKSPRGKADSGIQTRPSRSDKCKYTRQWGQNMCCLAVKLHIRVNSHNSSVLCDMPGM